MNKLAKQADRITLPNPCGHKLNYACKDLMCFGIDCPEYHYEPEANSQLATILAPKEQELIELRHENNMLRIENNALQRALKSYTEA